MKDDVPEPSSFEHVFLFYFVDRLLTHFWFLWLHFGSLLETLGSILYTFKYLFDFVSSMLGAFGFMLALLASF